MASISSIFFHLDIYKYIYVIYLLYIIILCKGIMILYNSIYAQFYCPPSCAPSWVYNYRHSAENNNRKQADPVAYALDLCKWVCVLFGIYRSEHEQRLDECIKGAQCVVTLRNPGMPCAHDKAPASFHAIWLHCAQGRSKRET